MSLCNSIDTLAMAYLDGELATEERHELETHLTECVPCRTRLDSERAEHALVHQMLAAPPTPDLLKARVTRALDGEDGAVRRAERRRWTRWALPGSAMLAAAAALAVFITARPPAASVGAVAHEAARVQTRPLPLEVQGTRTAAFLQQNFAPDIEPPRIAEPGSELIGARLLPRGVNGHDGALLSYRVDLGNRAFVLSVLVVRDVRGDELGGGAEVEVGGRTVHVVEDEGKTMVSYVDNRHLGYLFMAPDLSADELIGLVGRTNLVVP